MTLESADTCHSRKSPFKPGNGFGCEFSDMRTHRVAILSDDRLFKDGLHRLLSSEPSISILGLQELIPAADGVRAARPDVLLIDARMDAAIDQCADLKKACPRTRMILVGVSDDESAIRALAAGASGILDKNAEPQHLARAVHAVSKNEIWAPRRVLVSAWLRQIGQPASAPPAPAAAVPADLRLTNREMEVLRYAAAGLGNRELAGSLSISESTVKVHLTRIFQKTGLHGRAKLAAAYHGVAAPAAIRRPQFRRPA